MQLRRLPPPHLSGYEIVDGRVIDRSGKGVLVQAGDLRQWFPSGHCWQRGCAPDGGPGSYVEISHWIAGQKAGQLKFPADADDYTEAEIRRRNATGGKPLSWNSDGGDYSRC